MNRSFLLCIILAAAQLRAADSLTGTWKTVISKLDDGRDDTVYYELQQQGSTVRGRAVYPWGFMPITKGTVTGNSFDLLLTHPGDEWTFTAKGTIEGDQLKYRATTWGPEPKDYTAVRASPDEAKPPARIEPPPLHKIADNGLAKTPPMGWNSWNKFAHRVNDKVVPETADVMVSSGMRDAGYIYLNIDDTWQGVRGDGGVLQPNSKFPDMKALADYVHSKGLKFGIYSSPGPKTCGGYDGSYGYEEIDAKTWANWGVDFIKYDWCSASKVYGNKDLQPVYQKMGDALAKTGRPIVFSLCQYGMGDVWKWGPVVGGNLWRTTGDISDNWKSMSDIGFRQAPLARYAAPGHWNDPDMLEVGNGGMSDDEYRTHMTLWAMLSAPLLAGNDLTAMTDSTKSILLNRNVIAVDQDELGKQAELLRRSGTTEVWAKHLSHDGLAIALFNRGPQPASISVHASEVKLNDEAALHEIWSGQDTAFSSGSYQATVPSHGVVLLRTAVH